MLLSDICLTSALCLSHISGLSREQKGLGRPKLIEVAHVTCDWDTTFKVKRSKVKVTGPFCSPLSARQAAAAVGVGMCWPWKTAAICCRLRGSARRFGAHGGQGRGHIVAAARLQVVAIILLTTRKAISRKFCHAVPLPVIPYIYFQVYIYRS